MTDTENAASTSDSKTDSNSKVVAVIHRYGLDGLGDELVEYWTGDTSATMSLRELAEYFNRELLGQALRDASVSTLDGEVENFYRLLTSDDVSSGASVQAKNQLEQRGVDVDQLTDAFVSRQAIHTYLTNYREVSYSPDDGDPVETGATNIQRLEHRMATVIESNIERLRNTGRISLGEFNLLVDVRVFCEDCGTQYQATELLDQGACDCPRTAN